MQICKDFTSKIIQNMSQSVLYLVPCPISNADVNSSIPLDVLSQIVKIQIFIVENEKSARRFLKSINPQIIWDEIHIFELDKHQNHPITKEIEALFNEQKSIGLLSEAGMPCIADPGNLIVRLAHEKNWFVKPMVGPSSILLALIASGMNGQSFCFHGYLPHDAIEKKRFVLSMEKNAKHSTQLFIETPYRNDKLLKELIQTLDNNTRLMVAKDISGDDELIVSQTVKWWKSQEIVIGKFPCLFAIGV
jgi:16S rRNA (cytidine1402-2'-O)-methyltransferase